MRNLAWFALVLLLVPARARAGVPAPFVEEPEWVVSDDLDRATGLAWAPDGSNRLFIARKAGEIRIVKNGQVLPTPFVTVANVVTDSECGLVGIAFDPDFLSNHYLYAFVTVLRESDKKPEQRILRFDAQGDVAADQTTIVTGLPTRGRNHDGGGVGVGPDGKLYWAVGDTGDGTGGNDDLASLAAKVGRANRDGTAPADNPFHDGSGGARDFIWARGLRNPFSFTFQPRTGLLWVNVVGTFWEQVFIARKGEHLGWLAHEANQPSPMVRPVIKYFTNGRSVINLQTAGVGGARRANGVVTFTAMTPHLLRPGEKVTIAGVADPSFNGDFFVASASSDMSFSVAQPGPDAISGSPDSPLATATTAYLGGCVTGGEFWDSSHPPAAYRGDFIFGDYNSGNVMRATIDPATNGVTSVDWWGHDVGAMADLTVGPDGALYLIGHLTRRVKRFAYKPTAQGLVVTPLNLWTAEKQSMLVNVLLAMPPAGDVTVTVARAGGDEDLSVTAGATLTFTAANWNVPQTATISARADGDRVDDQATFSISAAGLPTETITVHARDDFAAQADDAGVDAGAPLDAAADVAVVFADAGLDAGAAPDAAVDVAIDAPADHPADDGFPGNGDARGLVADAQAPDVSAHAGDGAAPASPDTGAPPDAMGALGASSGCSCHTGGHGEPGGVATALLLGGLLLRRRRSRTHAG